MRWVRRERRRRCAGGCHVADLNVGGKTLFVVLSDVVVCCAW